MGRTIVRTKARDLTRTAILDTAMALAESEGLDAVSMRAVATRLGVTATALYRHVDDKRALLDGLVERLLEELPTPDPALPWPDRLGELVGAMRASARRHPDVFMLLLRLPVTTPAARARRDVLYAGIRDAGVPPRLVPRIERLLSTFILGFAASEAGGRFRGHKRAELDADLKWLEGVVKPAIAAAYGAEP